MFIGGETMELHKDTMEKFIDYLISHGYPRESLVTEYKASDRRRVDLAVIDTTTKVPIMIFEIKSRMNTKLIEMGREQLKKYIVDLNLNYDIPTYLVFPKQDRPYFQVVEVSTNDDEILDDVSPTTLDYNLSRRSRLLEKAKEAETDRDKTINHIKYICWIIAIALLIIGILSKLGLFDLSATDLVLLGAIVGLILTPYASKIKFWGIEFERYTKASEKR
jgi:hypothetical protein